MYYLPRRAVNHHGGLLLLLRLPLALGAPIQARVTSRRCDKKELSHPQTVDLLHHIYDRNQLSSLRMGSCVGGARVGEAATHSSSPFTVDIKSLFQRKVPRESGPQISHA